MSTVARFAVVLSICLGTAACGSSGSPVASIPSLPTTSPAVISVDQSCQADLDQIDWQADPVAVAAQYGTATMACDQLLSDFLHLGFLMSVGYRLFASDAGSLALPDDPSARIEALQRRRADSLSLIDIGV